MSNVKIGSFWVKKDKNGKMYMSGQLNTLDKDIDVVAFMNEKNGNDKAPDFTLYRSSEKKQETKPAQSNPFDSFSSSQPGPDDITVETIPFN